MYSHSKLERFKKSKEELAILGPEFKSEALPMVTQLYNTTYWILINERYTKKIIKQVFFEAIEYCNVTKNQSDWQSWIMRIWMREIVDYYSEKENDTETKFDFIENTEVEASKVTSFFNSINSDYNLVGSDLKRLLEKLPSLLRIPLILKEIHSFNYEKIAYLTDVPEGVIATRIYRARKLLFLSFDKDFLFEEEKKKWSQKESTKIIFELRKCASSVDKEFTSEQELIFNELVKNSLSLKAELLIQEGIKSLLKKCLLDNTSIERIKSIIECKARKKFHYE